MLSELGKLFYLDLNDDSLIRDLVSGAYSGVPATRDIQNLYPFSLFMSTLYRLSPDVPWYGMILLGLQCMCMVILLCQALRTIRPKGKKIYSVLGIFIVWILLCVLVSPHFFFVQYTVTAGLLCCTAIFLIITSGSAASIFASVILVGLAYTIRSELVLLLLPIVFLALLFSYVGELMGARAINEEIPGFKEIVTYPFRIDRYRRFGMGFVGMILVISLGWNVDRIAYADVGWQEFVRFFDARTEIYDFTGIPPYDGHSEFYDGIGLSENEVGLLKNYNFGLSDDINADTMEEIAVYAKKQTDPLRKRFVRALRNYIYRLHHLGLPEDVTWPQTDAPWNVFIILLYITLTIITWAGQPKEYSMREKLLATLWRPVLLFACRTSLWMYLIVRGRDPVRVTHPLMYAELAILFGLLIVQSRRESDEVVRKVDEAERRHRLLTLLNYAAMGLTLVVGIVYVGRNVSNIMVDEKRRAADNIPYEAMRAYAAGNPDNWYFMDVYSSVRETRPLFSEGKKTGAADNLDILGGWAVKSPEWADKIGQAGMDDAFTGLLQESTYFVAEINSDVSWLVRYYASEGVSIRVNRVDVVADTFVVYSVTEAGAL